MKTLDIKTLDIKSCSLDDQNDFNVGRITCPFCKNGTVLSVKGGRQKCNICEGRGLLTSEEEAQLKLEIGKYYPSSPSTTNK